MPKAKEFVGFHADPGEVEQTRKLAERLGVPVSELLRAGQAAMLRDAGSGTFEKPDCGWKWCLEDFEQFAEGLTLPDGNAFRLEGHLRLILKEVFAKNRVEVLALLPKGNFKTALLAALAVFHVLTVQNANCFIGAADKVQADEMYRFAAHYTETDERIDGLLLVRRSTREIRSEVDQGFIRVLASDDSRHGGKRQGFNATLAILDELHAHANQNLYVDMRSGLFKRNGMLVTVTTAGYDEESVLGELRAKFLAVEQDGGDIRRGLKVAKDGKLRVAKDGRLTIARAKSGRSVMLEWSCTAEDDLGDMKVVKLANPASGVTIESLEDGRESLTPWAFSRYRANVWTLGFESWIPVGSWDELAEPTLTIPDGSDAFVGVDMARYRDDAAIVVVQPREGYPAAVKAYTWKSGGQDDPIDYEQIKHSLRTLDERLRLLAVGFDPRYFDQSASELEQEGLPMVKFDQSHARMCPASANLREAIIRGRLRHDGDPTLKAHVVAAVAKDVGPDQFRVAKTKKTGPPIDACVALAMAWQLAFFRPAPSTPFVEVL